ncbi:MAG: peptide chain release factor 1 [Planctomycetota bacterium]
MSPEVEKQLGEVVKGIIRRYREIEAAFQDPALAPTSPQYTSLMKEWRRLERIVKPALEWERARARLEEAEALLADPESDAELQDLARTDAEEAKGEVERWGEEVKNLVVSAEAFSERDVVMEIRAGTGGEEASLFAADLLRMYQHYAELEGWRVEILSSHTTDLGGFKEVVLSFEGEDVYRRLRFESGGHRVQRVPETEAGGRIHTSACTVAVLPEPKEVEINLHVEDLKVDTFRASGPGGQKVNKTSSAVRMTHLPSGLVVSCQDEKSQHKNRAKAMKIMKSRLFELEQQKMADERSETRRTQIGSGDRSERVRTYNFPQNRVTDHRLKQNFSLQTIMAGDLGSLLEGLEALARAERLAQLEKESA